MKNLIPLLAAVTLTACAAVPPPLPPIDDRAVGRIPSYGVADASGASPFALPVPASPALVGWTMVAQAGAVDPGGGGPGFATSDALRIVVGW